MSGKETSLPLEMYGAYEIAMALACPRLLAKAPRWPSREEVLRKLDEASAFAGRTDERPDREEHVRAMRAAQPKLAELRHACSHWTPGHEVPPPLKLAARTLLVSGFGFSEPAEGWEDFDIDPPGHDENAGECFPADLGSLRPS